jgi:hypothetical protein
MLITTVPVAQQPSAANLRPCSQVVALGMVLTLWSGGRLRQDCFSSSMASAGGPLSISLAFSLSLTWPSTPSPGSAWAHVPDREI